MNPLADNLLRPLLPTIAGTAQEGKIEILGANRDDDAIQCSAAIALSLIRVRAAELCAWFRVKGKMANLRKLDMDIQITLFPLFFSRSGAS